MARLIRMDGTGHTTLAEWTEADDAAFEAAVREFQEHQGLGYIGTVPDGPGKATHVREPAPGRARDHAPPDSGRLMEQALPELASVPWRQRTNPQWLRRWGRIWHAWTLLYTVPFVVAGAGMLWLEPLGSGGPGGARARVDHPGAVRLSRGERGAPEGPAQCGAGRAGAGDLLGHDERDLQRETGLASRRVASGSGSSVRRAPCS